MAIRRYFLQVVVMLGDVCLLLACLYLLCNYPQSIFVWLICAAGFFSWKRSGGFMAWRPDNIRNFMANAKKIGL